MEFLKGRLGKKANNAREEEVAIQTLSNRLQHATLAADRRSAVLGLKSFSRQFRESVVEYGIRPLLATLDKDSGNPQMVKAILETLLVLFLRGDKSEDEASGWIASQSRVQNGKYPSALLMGNLEADQFSMWIADEVTASECHLKVLIDILQESQDYHIRLYTLQLFEFLVCTRATRTKETLINIPLAVPVIVSLLNDVNDPVRNEAILVLMALVNNNFNIQKLVAFENSFDRLFEIIDEEGGIRGSILVQDCLTLITNLLMYNASNQKYFLETDGVPKLAKLLSEPIEESLEEAVEGYAPPIIWTDQRLQNMAIALEICQSFLDEDNPDIEKNQNMLFQAGIFFCAMRLVFSPSTESPIRKTALQITGDLIAGNSELQLQFSQVDVPYLDPSMPSQLQKYNRLIPAPVALLNWALLSNSVHVFEIRMAAVYCLRCFFKENSESKIAFLTDQARASRNPDYYEELANQKPEAINGDSEQAGQTENTEQTDSVPSDRAPTSVKPDSLDEDTVKVPYANIFSTLMDFDFANKLNPYRVWFAATVLVYLFEDCPENRQAARELSIGNAEDGEEVMTCIQAVAGILTTTLDDQDPRIAIGLMNLLTIWLYEDFDAINDFLSDSSIIKSVLAFLSKNSTESSDLVHGMASILVGITYEFSQKASPIPRIELHSLVTKALGANNYALKVKQFKECAEFADFSDPLSSEVERDSTGLPKVYFIATYVALVKDNYYRIRKALTHSPLVEPQVRISYEVFELLESKNAQMAEDLKEMKEEAEKKEEDLKAKILTAQEELEQSQELLEKLTIEVGLLRESEVELTDRIEILSSELKQTQTEKTKAEKDAEQYSSELHKLSRQNYSNEGSLNLIKQKLSDTEAAKKKAEDGINKMSRELFQLTRQKSDLETKIAKLEKEIAQMKSYHENTVKDYESQLNSVRATNEGLRTKIRVLEQQLIELADERDRALLRIHELQANATDAESTHELLMEKLRSAATMVQDLRKVNSEQAAYAQKLQAELAEKAKDVQISLSFQEELTSLRERNEALESVIASMKAATGEDNDEVQRRLLDALESKSTHEAKVKSLLTEIESLKVQLALEKASFQQSELTHHETVQQLELRNQDTRQRNSELEALATSLKAALEIFNENEELLKLQIRSKEEEILALQKELTDTIETASTLQSDLEDQVNAVREQVAELESSRSQAQKDFETLKAEYEELKLKHGQAQELSKEESDTLEKLKASEEQVRDWTEKLEEKNEELVNAESKITHLEEQHKSLTEKAEQTASEHDQKQAEFEEVRERLSSSIQDLEKSKEQLSDEIEELKAAHLEAIETLKKEHTEQLQLHSNNDQDVSEQNELFAKQKEDFEKTVADHENLKADYEQIKLSFEQLLDKSASIQDSKSEADQKIVELTESVDSLKAELSAAEQEKAELLEKLEQLEEGATSKSFDRKRSSSSSSHIQNGSHDSVKDALSKEVANKIAELLAKDHLISEIKKKLESSTIALEDLTDRNESLESEMREMTKEAKDAEKTKNELEKKLQTFEEEMESAIILNDNLNQELDDKAQELKEKISEFNAEKDAFKEDISEHLGVEKELTKQINSLEKELKKRVADHEKDRKRFAGGAEGVLKEHADTISQLEASIESLKESHEAKLKEIEESHTAKYTELEEESQKLEAKCEELAGELSSHEAAKTEWEALEKERKTRIADLEESLAESKGLLEEKDREIALLKNRLETIEKELKETAGVLSEKLAELESAQKHDSDASDALEAEVKALQEKLAQSELQKEQLNTELRESREVSQKLKLQLGEIEESVGNQNNAVSGLEQTISELESNISRIETELSDAKSALSDKSTQLEELETQLEANQAENRASQESDLAGLQEQVLELEKKLKDAQSDNSALTKEALEAKEHQDTLVSKLAETERRLNEQISQKTEELEEVRSKQAGLESENSAMKKSLEDVLLSKAELESKLAAAASDLNNAILSDTEYSTQIEHLQAKARESDELVFDLKTKLGDYVDEKMQLEQALEKVQLEQKQYQDEAAALAEEKLRLQKELESAEQLLVSEKQRLQELESAEQVSSEERLELQKKLDAANESLSSEKTKLQSDLDAAEHLSEEKSKLQKELEAAQNSFNQEKQRLQSELEAAQTSLSDEKQRLQKELESSQDSFNGEKQKLQEELEAALRSVESLQRSGHDATQTLQEQTSQLEAELESKNNQVEELTLQLNEESSRSTQSASEVVHLTSALDELESSHQTEKHQWELRYSATTAENADLQTELASIREQLAETQKSSQQSAQVKSLENGSSEESKAAENGPDEATRALHAEIASLKQQLAAKESVESDFDELVVLWEEQEKRMAKYRDQLRGLGQAVSSDEEEEEE